jgi:hypothetical protein
VLTGLSRAADPQSVRELLAPHFNDGVEIESVALHDFAYRPQRTASFVYELRLRDDTGARHRHFMHAWLGDVGRTRRRHARLRGRRWVTPRFGPAFLHFPQLGFLLFGFPNDPRLRVESLADPAGALATFRAHPGILRQAADSCASDVVHYVPHKRLVMRHLVQPGARQLYTKSYAHPRGALVFAIAKQLWEHGRGDPDAFMIATPLAYLHESRTLVQEGLQGWRHLPYGDWVRATPCMRALGRGLARIHTSKVLVDSTWGPQQELARFEKVAHLVRRFEPRCGDALDVLRPLALRRVPALSAQHSVPIHGAFRLGQMLERDERVALVDLDGFRLGDPRSDLGSLVAQLHARVATERLEAAAASTATQVLLDAYAGDVPWKCDDAALAWYVGLRLFSKHAMGPVNHMKEGACDRIRALLEVSHRILASGNAAFQ